jgi:hypothetical protein
VQLLRLVLAPWLLLQLVAAAALPAPLVSAGAEFTMVLVGLETRFQRIAALLLSTST